MKQRTYHFILIFIVLIFPQIRCASQQEHTIHHHKKYGTRSYQLPCKYEVDLTFYRHQTSNYPLDTADIHYQRSGKVPLKVFLDSKEAYASISVESTLYTHRTKKHSTYRDRISLSFSEEKPMKIRVANIGELSIESDLTPLTEKYQINYHIPHDREQIGHYQMYTLKEGSSLTFHCP